MATRSMIPALSRRITTTNIPWQQRPNPELLDNSDGLSVDSSRCVSRDISPSTSQREIATARPTARTTTGCVDDACDHKDDSECNRLGKGIEMIRLTCDRSEAAIQDLLGLRISGSRTAGVFVQGLQHGSTAEKNGHIQIGDQLLQVESICLLGLAPDQAVRALRTTFSLSTNPYVRLTIAHSWAEKCDRHYRPVSSLRPFSSSMTLLASSKSESSLSAALNAIDIDNPPSLASTETPTGSPPNYVAAGTFRAKVNSSGSSSQITMKSLLPVQQTNQHSLGATKLRKVLTDHTSKDKPQARMFEVVTTAAMINHHHQVSSTQSMHNLDAKLRNNTSVLASTSKNGFVRLENEKPKRKTSNNNKISHDSNSPIFNSTSIDGSNHSSILPGSLEDDEVSLLRQRRKPSSNGSCKTTDSMPSRSTMITDFNTSISIDDDPSSTGTPRFRQVRQWDSEKTLTTPSSAGSSVEEDAVGVRVENGSRRQSKKSELSQMLSNVQRKNMNRKKSGADDLPLVSFDQLNRTSPSPTNNHKRSVQSSSSGQSKSSKGSEGAQSRGSQGSQQLSWQCPVCLDGASRIRRTKRRMMSTACGHVFCNSCVEDVVGKHHVCPTCRASIKSLNDVHPIFM